jgi:integrase
VREHVVPITDDIYAILKSLPLFKSGDYLFSTTFGKKPAWISAKVKRRLDARMVRTLRAMARIRGDDAAKVELRPFVNHDLRRTMRTGLSKLRIDADIRELVLAHALKGITKVYDRYDYLNEKRHALECWSEYVWNLVQPKPDNVIRLQSSGSARQLQ